MKTLLIPAALMFLVSCAPKNRDADFASVADSYFNEVVFRFDPAQATQQGFHQYDPQLPSLSASEIREQVAALRRFESEIGKFDERNLTDTAAADRRILVAQINGRLLELESIRSWEKQPDAYSSAAANAIFVIMSRHYAPPEERLKSVIARERLIPRTLQSARENLKNPPRIHTEVALEQLPGIIGFFKKDVPAAFEGAGDSQLKSDFQSANQGVIDALASYEDFLKKLLSQSNGEFRIGAENYRKKLLYDEMVDIPLPRLLEIGYQDLRRNQEALAKTPALIDPKQTPDKILAGLQEDHPAADALLGAFQGTLAGLKSYIEEHQIVTIPSKEVPVVEETPPFMRALTTASMDTPGPFEKGPVEAFFNVTLPSPSWNAKQTEEYMEGFSRGTMLSTAIHEVFPGHYTQFVWLRQAPSKVRKLVGCGSNAEGWAHYTEQMMLDEGYGGGDPKLRLGQLQDALLRDARFIVGIRMHTEGMTPEQAVEFFVKEGRQVRPVAEKEAKRGASDPTYLVYTLGKLEILKLREDYKKAKGAQYTLRGFHDALLDQGYPPIPIVRRALLGADSPAL